MVSAEAAQIFIGIIGNITSLIVFLLPAPTFWRMIKNKAVGEYHPYVDMAACMNCMFWILYGLPVVVQDIVVVITMNSIDLVLELVYLTIFLVYDDQNRRRKVLLGLMGEVVLVGIVAGVVIGYFYSYMDQRSLIMGVISVISTIITFASPLTIMKKVIETKRVEPMPFHHSLIGLLNCCIWIAYALIKLDIYILISNGLGAVLNIMQLITSAIYLKSMMTSDWVSFF